MTKFLFSATYYSNISANFMGIRSLGEAVAGDKKLLHFTGNSDHILLINTKPARIGLWFYQLVACLSHGLPYQLCLMMMAADKSREESSPVDEVVRVWKTAIDSFGMCDKYYLFTGFIKVLTEREEGANKPLALLIGSARAS